MTSMYNNHQNHVEISPLGDCAVVVKLGHRIDEETHRKVQALYHHLIVHPLPGMIEAVPAYVSVTIYYNPLKLVQSLGNHLAYLSTESQSPYETIRVLIDTMLIRLDIHISIKSRVVPIPVCYGGELGPDLLVVAQYNELSEEEVIQLHCSRDYLVHMIGFVPGFPYLGGMSERITTPRRSSPRLSIPPGSVGIGGSQTGIYPLASPGGWQLIGRTPIPLFRPSESTPSLLKAGDIVRFQPISVQQYAEWKEG